MLQLNKCKYLKIKHEIKITYNLTAHTTSIWRIKTNFLCPMANKHFNEHISILNNEIVFWSLLGTYNLLIISMYERRWTDVAMLELVYVKTQ